MKFSDLKFVSIPSAMYGANGIAATCEFPNGYGASVIRHDFSYGGRNGLYEIAVLKHNDICYDSPITADVIGYCSEDRISEILAEIENLPNA